MSRAAWAVDGTHAKAGAPFPWTPFIFLAAGSFIPSLVFFLFRASSGALGLMGAMLFMIGLTLIGVGKPIDGREASRSATLLAVLLAGIGLHGAVAGFLYPPDPIRSAASGLALAMMIFTGAVMGRNIFGWDDEALRKTTNLLRLLFFIVGLMGVLGIQPPVQGGYAKPIFPFTEPSHYALAFTPLLIDGCVRFSGWKRYVLLLGAYGIAFFVQSLSLVVGTTLAAFICLPVWQLALGSAAAYTIPQVLDVQYFVDRLDLSYQSNNLSTLVYIQGWELVQESFDKTLGWGIGFQQLGFAPLYSPTSDLIYQLLRDDANLKDGGFTGSKLLSEFGVFAILFLAAFAFVALKAAWKLRRKARRAAALAGGETLAYAFLAAYIIEMFVRGVGYFSGTSLFAISAFFYLRRALRTSAAESPEARPALSR